MVFKQHQAYKNNSRKEGIVGLSRTAWNVIIHADLEDYGAFKHRVEESWASLLTIKSRLKNDSHIDNMMSLLTNKATRLQQHDDIIQQTQARKTQRVPRAPLKAFGAIYHAVFGLMDEDHADELLQKVQQSRQNEEYLLDLLRNQSSVQDATVQMMKKQNEVIWGNFNIINTAMYSMKNALNTAIDHEVFLDAYETLSMAMDAFEQLQRDIINIIWNTNGNFLDSLLPTTQFQKQIQRIVLNMPEGVQLPTLDPLELGRISKITTRTTSSAILFNLQPGCYLHSEDVSLWAYEDLTTDVDFWVPVLNLTTQLPSMEHIKFQGELRTFKISDLPRQGRILGFPWIYIMQPATLPAPQQQY
ncbi:hypothetical protein ACLKA6_008461 [Drosophila palustris]